ncbi:unnamed protein product [Merluccius merluccius]
MMVKLSRLTSSSGTESSSHVSDSPMMQASRISPLGICRACARSSNYHHSWSNFYTISLLFSRSSLYTLNFHLSWSNFNTSSLLFSCSSLCALNIPLLISFCFHPGP